MLEYLQTPRRNQYDAVYNIYGDFNDHYGTLPNIVSACTYLSGGISYLSYDRSLEFLRIADHIQSGTAVIAGGSRYVNGSRVEGHVVTIYGVDRDKSLVLYVDPYDPNNQGDSYRRHLYNYTDFLSGFAGAYRYDCTVI